MKDLLALRDSKILQMIDADAYSGESHQGPRSAAAFWAAYDAHVKELPPK